MPNAKSTAKVGRQTKKRTGYIVTSLRLLAQHNRELRKFAQNEGLSFNGWATSILLKEARKGITTNGQASTEN